MISEQLRRARAYEARMGALISPAERPLFHLTPTTGWLNDPNGFSVYRGEYHLFYQYHPYSTSWGPMHWGHCKSRDLLRWERLPAALAPDQPYDRDGCFSGSAAETPDGRHLLMYTGRRLEEGREVQAQCLAVGNGENYEKLSANPVITGEQLPPGGSAQDFRDPKLWRDGSRWYAVAGNRAGDGSGEVLLYSSEDLERWRLEGALDRSANQWGKMWECPDFFSLDGQSILLVSPQELEAPGPEFHNGQEVLCILGGLDGGGRFIRQSISPVDQGLDFYAPQTALLPDGRRVMIGWMQAAGEPSCYVPKGQKWFGQLTLPRELSVRDGRLLQSPVRELEAWRKERVSYENVPLSGSLTLPGVSGRTLDMKIALRCRGDGTFTLKFAQDGHRFTALCFQSGPNLLTLDRTYSGFPCNLVHRRTVPVRDRAGELELRLILDRFSVEVFVNGGEQVLSATLYTPQEADGISFHAQGRAEMDLERYRLAEPACQDRG